MAGRCGTRPCESTQKCVGTVDIYTCIDTDLEQVLGVPNGGDLGWWMGGEECDEGTFAMGYEMKIEANQGQGDDTALNGIKLICKSLDGTLSNTITSATAPWGDWTGETYCTGSHGPSFLTSFGLQVDPWTGDGEDDTAANFIKFKCRDIVGIHEAYELSKDPGIGDLGSYGHWSSECAVNSAICGINPRVQMPVDGDNTALNDVVFLCCPLTN